MIALVYSDAGDWVGLYRDDTLLYEGHSIDEDKLLKLLGIEFETYDVDISDVGRLPYDLADVVRDTYASN